MRQKEKRRIKQRAERRKDAEALRIRQSTPGDELYISINNAECLKCYCEFDPQLHKVCPSCKGRG